MKTCPTKDEFLKQMAKDHGLDANGVAEAARLYGRIMEIADSKGSKYSQYTKKMQEFVMEAVKPLVSKDADMVINSIINGLAFKAGSYDPAKHEIKIAVVPEMEQLVKAGEEVVMGRYLKTVKDVDSMSAQQLTSYMAKDPAYRQLPAEAKVVAKKLAKDIVELIAEVGTHAVTHEVLHAGIVIHRIKNPDSTAVKRLDELYKVALDNKKQILQLMGTYDVDNEYWAKNVNEFIAEAMSNPKLMAAMDQIQVKAGNKISSLFRQMYDALMAVLGFSKQDSLYAYVLDGYVAAIEEQVKDTNAEKHAPGTVKADMLNLEIKSKALPELSIIGAVDTAAAGVLQSAFSAAAGAWGPTIKRLHKSAYRNSSVYNGVVSLLRDQVWNSKLANDLRATLGVDGTINDKVLRKVLNIGTQMQQESAHILTTAIPELRARVNKVFSSKDEQQAVNKVYAKTGIAHIMVSNEAEALLTGDRTIEEILEEYKNKGVDTTVGDELAEMYVTGKIGKSKATNIEKVTFNNEAVQRPLLNQYIAFAAISRIDGGLEVLRKMHKEDVGLYETLRETAIQVKATSELVNGVTRGVANTLYSDYDGNFTLDVSEKNYEYKLVAPSPDNSMTYSKEMGWKKLKTPSNGYELYAREKDTGFSVKGVGLSEDRFPNGYLLSEAWVEKQLRKDPTFLEDNNISVTHINGVKKYRLNLLEEVKAELGVLDDVAESLFRTLVQNKELIENQKVKRIILASATMVVTDENIKELQDEIKRAKKGLATVKPLPMFLKLHKDFTGEIPVEVIAYYKKPDGRISSYEEFNSNVDYIRSNMEHILLDSKSNAIFDKYKQKQMRQVEDIYRHLVSLFKIRTISNPVKLFGDVMANSVLLADVPYVKMLEYSKQYAAGMEELGKLRNKKVELELKALDGSGQYDKELEEVMKAIKKSPLYPALKHGFLQSMSTGLVLKDFESIRGLQKDMDLMIDKLLNGKKERTWAGEIVKWLSTAGFNGEDVLMFLSKISKDKSETVGNEFEAMAKRLKAIKDSDDMVRYVGEILGTPSSELVRQSSNIMTNVDGVSKWILYRHLRVNGMGDDAAAKKSNDTFLDYRVNLPTSVKQLSDLGILMFPSFWMKYQRVLFEMLKHNPVSAVGGYSLESILGLNHLHPLNASIANKLMEGTVVGVVDPFNQRLWNPWYFLTH